LLEIFLAHLAVLLIAFLKLLWVKKASRQGAKNVGPPFPLQTNLQ